MVDGESGRSGEDEALGRNLSKDLIPICSPGPSTPKVNDRRLRKCALRGGSVL